ncbi:metallophosphoesterase family protein [Candidatus Bathyarchaeota archaeon]|nr:metallophosphoesterase family protein [Candidatus Bathyarchaeota archaeon]
MTNTSFLHLRHLRRFSEIISRVQANILVMEHTHLPLLEKFTEGWVINPGSVGQPRDMDPRASYAILDVDDKKTDLTLLESSTMLRRWLLK